ncbi:hypothetical protein ACS0TY_000396 [Phlomoides rotata]
MMTSSISGTDHHICFTGLRTTPLLLKHCYDALSRATYWLPVDGYIKFFDTHAVLAKTRWIQAHSPVCTIQWNRDKSELLSSQNQLPSLWEYPLMVKVAKLTGHMSRVLHMAQILILYIT